MVKPEEIVFTDLWRWRFGCSGVGVKASAEFFQFPMPGQIKPLLQFPNSHLLKNSFLPTKDPNN
jgi:hypothetical protein